MIEDRLPSVYKSTAWPSHAWFTPGCLGTRKCAATQSTVWARAPPLSVSHQFHSRERVRETHSGTHWVSDVVSIQTISDGFIEIGPGVPSSSTLLSPQCSNFLYFLGRTCPLCFSEMQRERCRVANAKGCALRQALKPAASARGRRRPAAAPAACRRVSSSPVCRDIRSRSESITTSQRFASRHSRSAIRSASLACLARSKYL